MVGCTTVEKPNKDVLFQVSTIDALLAGVYDGEISVAELNQNGDFGIGTFNSLDGEMVAVDGNIYKIRTDGVAYLMGDEEKTPFAVMTFFEPDEKVFMTGEIDYNELQEYLDNALGSKNIFYAFRIQGEFDYIKTRSVPKQSRPYPKLVDAVAKQAIFEFKDVKGTIIGFRSPDYVDGINVPGYHIHFITDDRKAGGHLLSVQMNDITVEVDHTTDFYMTLPKQGDFYDIDLSEDKQEELTKVEKD